MNSSMVVLSLFLAVPIHAFSAQTETQVSSSKAAVFHHPSLSTIDAVSAVTNKQTMCIPKQYNPFNAQRITSALYARPKSKWDDLTDEDDDDDYETNESKSSSSVDVPKDMLYTEANIRRQADTYDQLVAVGGPGVVNDVYVRAPGGKEWWLVGKVARVSGERCVVRKSITLVGFQYSTNFSSISPYRHTTTKMYYQSRRLRSNGH